MIFEPFDNTHIVYIIGYTILFITTYFLIQFSSNPREKLKILSLFIILIKLEEGFLRYSLFETRFVELLPLHFCNLTLMFALIGIFFNCTSLLHTVFFWSIGAVASILFPETRDMLPSFFNISFFTTHMFIIFVAVVEYKLFNLQLTYLSWKRSFNRMNLAMLIIFYLNKSLDTNYFYINRKPTFNSPLDYFGEWPYYIIVMEIIYIILTLSLLFLTDKNNDIKKKLINIIKKSS